MTWDIVTALALIFSIIVTWFQRKTIFELERDIWEIETAYKNETGKPYQYKHRMFQSWGEKEKTTEEQN